MQAKLLMKGQGTHTCVLTASAELKLLKKQPAKEKLQAIQEGLEDRLEQAQAAVIGQSCHCHAAMGAHL